MDRIFAYIDGYNLYHALKEKKWSKYYWLNIPDLMKSFLKNNQELKKIYYFTAYSPYPESRKRQVTYIEALETIALQELIPFKTIKGRFSSETMFCPNPTCLEIVQCKNCEEIVILQHEKETDVNISVQLLKDTFEERFDRAFLITADSDQVGTITSIRELIPQIEIAVILPPGRTSNELRKSANFTWHIEPSKLIKYQLPEIINKTDGRNLTRPIEWN
jgi:uncharacterized LabA/DUF88 family protein